MKFDKGRIWLSIPEELFIPTIGNLQGVITRLTYSKTLKAARSIGCSGTQPAAIRTSKKTVLKALDNSLTV